VTTRTLKSIAARLPESWQAELKRLYFGRQIARGTFVATEHEFARLPELLAPGDWAIDVGANVGHHTKRMSDLVGPSGRVLAFEPVPATFELLAANVGRFRHANVSLFNATVSSGLQVLGMSLPRLDRRLICCHEAQFERDGGAMRVLSTSLDSLHVRLAHSFGEDRRRRSRGGGDLRHGEADRAPSADPDRRDLVRAGRRTAPRPRLSMRTRRGFVEPAVHAWRKKVNS
jgi:FkbM family methyltransferase